MYRAALQRLATLPQPAYIDQTSHRIVLQQTPQGNISSALDERVLFNSKTRRECVFILPYSDHSQVLFSRSYFAPDVWLIHPALPPGARINFTPDLSDLKTIAVVTSASSYTVRLAGVNALSNGGTAYHLILTPTQDPRVHNLRELWVNAKTYDIMRAVIVGAYAPDPRAPVEPSTVTEDFGQVGPYWVVIHHTWTYNDMLDHVLFRFEDTATEMRFPPSIPDWYFDKAQFTAHRSQVNTDGSVDR